MKNIFKNKTVLVTGGTGSIGSYVVNELLKKNCKIIFMSNIYIILNIYSYLFLTIIIILIHMCKNKYCCNSFF